MVAHAYNPSPQEAETGQSQWVWGPPELQSETLPLKETNKQPGEQCFLCVWHLTEAAVATARELGGTAQEKKDARKLTKKDQDQ